MLGAPLRLLTDRRDSPSVVVYRMGLQQASSQQMGIGKRKRHLLAFYFMKYCRL